MARHGSSVVTDDVLLRDVIDEDLPVFFEYQRDPQANQMAAVPARDRDAFMAHWTKILADETIAKQTILVNEQVAGNIVSFDQDGRREVGYWLGREYWGRGVATKALSAFLDHVTERPLYAHVAKHNIASLRVLEKCGFTITDEDKGFSNAPGEEAFEEFILILEGNAGDDAP